MSLAITKKPISENTHKTKHDMSHVDSWNSFAACSHSQIPIIQRKTICPCDGGCPRCAGVIQTKLTNLQSAVQMKSGRPFAEGPSYEEEEIIQSILRIMPFVQRRVEDEKVILQTKGDIGKTPDVTSNAEARINTLKGGVQPLTESIKNYFEPRFHIDFCNVRIYPNAPEVTAPLRARAVTKGQDIYFYPREFRPNLPEGDALIRHELAHTLQTRWWRNTPNQADRFVLRPDNALEQNAEAIASGDTRQVLNAPAGAVLRSPFDSESVEERERRERLLHSVSNAINRITDLLRTGGLLEGVEVATERSGVSGVIYYAHSAEDSLFASYAERDARLRRIVRSLIAIASLYRSAPIPAEFPAPSPIMVDVSRGGETPRPVIHYESSITNPRGTTTFTGTREWADLQAAYERYYISQGQMTDDIDWLYLDPTRRVVPGAARGAPRIGRGIPTGFYMVVPDIERDPLRYWRLTGFDPIPRGSVIVELWHDDFGYYYRHRGQRIDVPRPWNR